MSSPTTVETFAGTGEEMAKILVFKSCKMAPQFTWSINCHVTDQTLLYSKSRTQFHGPKSELPQLRSTLLGILCFKCFHTFFLNSD